MRVSTGSRVRVTVIQLRAFYARRRGKGRLLQEKRSSVTVITGLGIDDKDAGQRRSTLHFALDDQGTSTAETGGLQPPVRLPRCTRSLETEEEVWGR
ncbi:hypothetical protein X777_05927 [Ooceraea biroi]|uniref:Uncharacterized protein n=1 Tax=Ooceraea biroi TaxID=2015173 RepID=A0A026WDP9_OOCBI|nr:hypothetical protein X777_05927 [Ooceraea biroi]